MRTIGVSLWVHERHRHALQIRAPGWCDLAGDAQRRADNRQPERCPGPQRGEEQLLQTLARSAVSQVHILTPCRQARVQWCAHTTTCASLHTFHVHCCHPQRMLMELKGASHQAQPHTCLPSSMPPAKPWKQPTPPSKQNLRQQKQLEQTRQQMQSACVCAPMCPAWASPACDSTGACAKRQHPSTPWRTSSLAHCCMKLGL